MTLPDLERKYQEKKASLVLPRGLFVERDGRKVRQVQEHPVYAGMVEAMDTATGKVLAALEAAGIGGNTMVIFTSDNGGLSTSEGHPTSNVPLRGGKGWMYEGGIRVPLLLRAPGSGLAAGSICAAAVNSNDIMPTAIEYARLAAHPSRPLDGHSLVSAVVDEPPAAGRALFWHYPHYGNQGGSPAQAIRLGDWKLIRFFGEDRDRDRLELYNLADDIGEDHNVVLEQPAIRNDLAARLDRWSRDVGARYPTAK
jgi:arylsulfatase A-like enzyme